MQVEVLRCPSCRGRLVASGEGLHCESAACGAVHPVVAGDPVLIRKAGSVFTHAEFVARTSSSRPAAARSPSGCSGCPPPRA